MNQTVNWSDDIDYDTIWFVVGQITNQISGQGIQQLQEKLEDEGLVMTGALKSSLFKEVRQNNQAWMTEMAMQFEAYGRFKDMKQMHYSKQMPVDEDSNKGFQAWVKEVMAGAPGKTPFSFVSGRKNGSFPRDREVAVRQIAWAVARSRIYQPIIQRKGKGWYIKNYMKEIYGLLEVNIQAAAAQAAMNTVKKALKDRP